MKELTLQVALFQGAQCLKPYCTNPHLESELLMAFVLKVDRVFLYREGKTLLKEGVHESFLQLLDRRLKGEPMAYLLGEREFFSRLFFVDSKVLIPRPETETLVETVLDYCPLEKAQVLDLGTGSGVIALTLALERPNWSIWAVDIEVGALAMAQKNAERHSVHNVVLMQSDWMNAVPPQERFHVIVSNPPYLGQEDIHLTQGDLRFEPKRALIGGVSGLDAILAILARARDALHPSGWIFFEHGWEQGEAVRKALQEQGFGNIGSRRDLSGLDRLSYGQNIN